MFSGASDEMRAKCDWSECSEPSKDRNVLLVLNDDRMLFFQSCLRNCEVGVKTFYMCL